METQISYDLGEQVIAELKELNKTLERIIREKHEKECTYSSLSRNTPTSELERKSEGEGDESK